VDVDMVLNHLSLGTPAAEERTARELMSELIGTLSTAVKLGVKTLRTQNSIYALILAQDYPVARWLNDNQVSQDERDFLLTLSTQTPPIADLTDPELENRVDLSEFRYQGELATELGIAYLLDALAVSLLSEAKWDCSRLELSVRRLDENQEIIDERVEIVHASRRNHVLEHAEEIQHRIRTGVRDGAELWHRRAELLPHLEFCQNVGEQLQNIRTGSLMLRPIEKRLFEFEDYCQTWESGPFDPDSLPSKASPESQATIQQFGEERTFLCPDGEYRVFSWHVRLTPLAWRIHFFPDVGPGRMIIGYIGKHLPTVNFPN